MSRQIALTLLGIYAVSVITATLWIGLTFGFWYGVGFWFGMGFLMWVIDQVKK